MHKPWNDYHNKFSEHPSSYIVCVLSRVQLFETPWTVAHHSSLRGILEAIILEWVAISSSRRSSRLRDLNHISYVSCIGGRFFTTSTTGLQIVQAVILKWIVISYARGSSRLRDWTCVSCISRIGRWILYHCTTWNPTHLKI